MVQAFGGFIADLDELVYMCNLQFTNEILVHDFHEHCSVHFKKALMLIIGFYLKDGHAQASRDKISEFVEQEVN